MRGWLARIAMLALVLGPAAASGDSPATVVAATPGSDGASITRFTLRFSEPMAPLGVGTAPLAMVCPTDGQGRWTDPQTFVWEFAGPLGGGTTCRATLNDGLKSLAGKDIVGTRAFDIDAGGPIPRAVLAGADTNAIEEGQTFFVATNGAVDRASATAGAYCAVDGIGERIAVDLLSPATATEILPKLGSDWRLSNFLESAGIPSPLPQRAADLRAALANVVALKCRRPLPPGRDVALVWGASIRSPAGRIVGEDRRFDFTVREAFTAKLSCSRSNPRAGCSPIEPISVSFTAPVPRAEALGVRLEIDGGRVLTPETASKDAMLSQVRFKPLLSGATTARLTMPDALRDESGRALENARRFPLEVAIADPPPLVKFAAPFGIIEAGQDAALPVTVRGVEPSLGLGVRSVSGGTARIAADDRAVADWLRRVAKSQENDFRDEKRGSESVTVNHTGATALLPPGTAGVERTSLSLPGAGKAFEVIGVPLGGPGFYVTELASPVLGRTLLGRPATRYVAAAALVTNLAVHFKWGREASLAWVTALDTGKPVAGAAIRISDSCSGKQLGSGTTDATGRLIVRGGLPAPSMAEDCPSGEYASDESPPLMISARSGGDYSFTLTSWAKGIRPYDFDLPYGWSAPEPTFHTIYDRTLLRAGETLRMKHVLRLPVAAGFKSGGAMTGTLVLQHRGSETSFELPITLGRDGIGETSWTAPKGAPTGDYDLTLRSKDRTLSSGQSFRLDEYRLPSMRASVSGPKEASVRPKKLPIDLFVGYLSGGGAARAPVRVRTAWEALSDTPKGWEGWSFGGNPVVEGTVPIDEDQNSASTPMPPATTLPLALDEAGALRTAITVPELQDSARLTVEMDYQDANGETLTASSAIPVNAAAVRVGIKPDGWLQKSDEVRIKLVAIGPDGSVQRGRRIKVRLYTREILSARRRLIGGFYAFDNSARTKAIDASCSTSTDAQGLASCTLDPGVSGEVIAVATTEDDAGNITRAVTSLWLAGDDDWWFGGDNGDRMDIVPDAKSYASGAVAHVQVRMPFRSATALVTVEREGVLSSFVTDISGKDPVIDVPLAGNYAPDVYISVMAVRGRVAGWRLWLADFARRWNLPWFSREGASPTALVDLAKPAYRIGIAKVSVGWDAHALKVAVAADRSRYRIRDTARVGVKVTAPDGRAPKSAEIAFAAVDEALLQLSPNDSWKLLDAMMGDRPLAVLTSSGQMQVVGKRHYGRKAVASGGGGGGDLSALTRADFRPVLTWKGRVPLDAEGRAVINVPLADSLSSYRLVAIATAGDGQFGTGSTTVRTVQDLSIFAGLPPQVRSGDFYAATFTLRNGSDRPLTVNATVDLFPRVATGKPATVTIPAGGAVPVTWRLTAPEKLSKLRWVVTARSSDGRANDRIQIDETIIPAVREEVWAANLLRIGEGTSLPLIRPAGALPGRGGISIALSASPAPPLDGVRAYMFAYPYGCFEQRLSKAIALGDGGAWSALASELPTYIAGNGLLRYWPGEEQPGSIALTAYALSVTAEAGLAWPEEQKTRLLQALRGVVDGVIAEEGAGPGDKRMLRLAALGALARAGAATPSMLGQVDIPVADMPTGMLADWLVTLARTAGADPGAIVAAETALRGRIVYEGTRLDLVDKANAPWWMMVSADEMALKALLAVAGRPGWEADAPRMMLGVALRQRRGHWDTTPANAWGTIAVRRFAAAYGGTVPGGITTAQLGGSILRRPWPQPANAGPLVLPLPAGRAPLLLSHSAQPGPWATVSIRAAVPLTAPRFSGYRVSREVSFLQQKTKGQISRGDVMKIKLTVEAPVDRSWVVIEDPIPAGSSIIGGGGGQSALMAAEASGGASPSYVERGLDAWRGYFGWLPTGTTSVEYAVRINGSGRFQLPPTRVEAMYSPEINAAIPNATVVVAP